MSVFDSLPPRVREAIRNSAFDWETSMVKLALDQGMSEDVMVAGIEREDRLKINRDRTVVWNIEDEEGK
jgi:hypothetical protein